MLAQRSLYIIEDIGRDGTVGEGSAGGLGVAERVWKVCSEAGVLSISWRGVPLGGSECGGFVDALGWMRRSRCGSLRTER